MKEQLAMCKKFTKAKAAQCRERICDGRSKTNECKGTHPAAVAASFIVHPLDTHWQDAIVKEWAAAHPQQVRRGESATEWEALEKAHKQEAIDAINKTSAQSQKIWTYINDNYESVFEGKNQVGK